MMSSTQQLRRRRQPVQVEVANKGRTTSSSKHALSALPSWATPVLCLLLAFLTAGVYSSAVSYPFINLDDPTYVSDNHHVQAGLSWQTVTWAMTATDAFNWHPLTWLSHALDCQLYGLNAGAHHVTNIIIHVLNVTLLLLLMARATNAPVRSALVAALFAVHPLNVESVVWIAERKNVLSMLFFLLALGAYGWYAQKPNWRRYAALAVLFALGLAAKPMVITLPCVLFLLDYWPLARIKDWTAPSLRFPLIQLPWPRLVVEKLPLLILSAGSAVVTVIVQRVRESSSMPLGQLPLSLRLNNAVYSYAMYLANIFWPANLAAFYPHPLHSLRFWQIVLAATLLVAVSLFVWKQHANCPYGLVGWLWFLGTLIPVIGIIQVGEQAMADRYAYLPGIGIFLILVWGCADIVQAHFRTYRVSAVIAIAALAALSCMTFRQIVYWETPEILWAHTLEITKDNFIANDIMGHLLLSEGRPEAVTYFEAAAKSAPLPYYRAHLRIILGMTYSELGYYEQASENFAIARNTDSHQLQKMIGELTEIAAASPSGPAYWRLGVLLEGANQFAEAKRSFEKALQLDPQSSPPRAALERLNTRQR